MVVNSSNAVAIPQDRSGPPASPVRVDFVTAEQLAHFSKNTGQLPLAVICYGKNQAEHTLAHTLNIEVDLPQLGQTPLLEIWSSDTAVHTGHWQQFQYSYNGNLLFATLEVTDHGSEQLEQISEKYYQDMFKMINELGYPHLIRMWNYFPAINSETCGLERYQQFCVGRHHAFANSDKNFQDNLPAASAIGSNSGKRFLVYFIASRTAGTQVENPRQVSAFCYPKQYGPLSPSFSRGISMPWQNGTQLYLSGTASVVGHRTVHVDSVLDQLDETLTNIKTLCQHAVTPQIKLHMADLQGLKVYIRNREDYPEIKARLEQKLGSDTPILYLLGDICRQDLLLEIEGLFSRDT